MQPLLDDGMEPGQQEVEPGSLMRLLAHPRGWDSAEGADEVSLDARWGSNMKIREPLRRLTGTYRD